MGNRVGALWLTNSKAGNAFLSGNIDAGIFGQIGVVIFKNEKKDKDNQPDYHILLRDPRTEQEDEAPPPGQSGFP